MAAVRAKRKRAYHHGNLRRDLVTAALEIINKSGPEALTLRSVGTRLGVSQAAPYRHFASKEALLAAVAAEGFTAMLKQVATKLEGAGTDPMARYQSIAEGYMRFALAYPDHFRVMYAPRIHFEGAAVTAERRQALRLLMNAIEACQAAGLAAPGSSLIIATQAWAYAHGLATLYRDGLLHRSIDDEALVALSHDIALFLRPSGKVASIRRKRRVG